MARADLHNVSVDEGLARQGLCGQIHLPTGRCCVREHRHAGPCHFVHPADADRMVSEITVSVGRAAGDVQLGRGR